MNKLLQDKKAICIFIVPGLLLFTFVLFIPICQSVFYSLCNYDALTPPKFIGFTNYKNLLRDDTMKIALKNSMFFLIFSCVTQLIMGLLLAGLLTNIREMILKEYVEQIRDQYDYILIDCMPSLGVMTINALVAADRVLIPVQAAYLPVKGLQQLIKTVAVVKKRLNKKLSIEGILITMVDYRTNYAKDITEMLRDSYGDRVGVMESFIPFSVKVAEASAEGSSIFRYAPKCKAAESFERLTKEVLGR